MTCAWRLGGAAASWLQSMTKEPCPAVMLLRVFE